MAAKSMFRRFPVALWRGLGSTNVRRVLVLCSMFAVLMLAGFYFPSETADGSRPMADRAAPKRALAPKDPVARFNETKVGQLLFSSSQNDDCRRVLFDNRTGVFYEAGLVQCAQAAPSTAEVSGNDRLMAVRKAFVK